MLSRKTSAEPGQWKNERTPYLVEPMDACCMPGVREVTWMFSAQVGKTEGAMNVIGYYIQHDPAPILSVLEDEGKAEDWSKNRLSGLLTETPCMRGLVRSTRGRDSENTMTYKAYPGGYLAIAG
ncbi:MAG TPA: phage terminase large subunit family protein, partial [Dissulfurispiraceae bacterium]|nr:phage terminase large subunit family protein [Dissulfurispiraceae bacterium]